MVNQEIKAQLIADAEASIEADAAAEDGSAAVEEESSAKEEDSEAADEGDSSDESESEEEDEQEEDDESDSEDEEPEKPKGRAQARIQELHQKWKASEHEKELLKSQLSSLNKSPAEVDAVDQKLIDKGYKPEEIKNAKEFLAAMGLSPEAIADMQKQLKSMEQTKAIEADRNDLRSAIAETKTDLTAEKILSQVQKWAESDDARIRARASLDYPAIIRLMSSTTKKIVKKKIDAPEIPKSKTDPSAKEEQPEFVWDPADRIGSMRRLQATVNG